MPRTVQEVCDRARVPLGDPTKVRYPDTDLAQGANDALRVLRQRRPDLFFGSLGTTMAVADLALGDQLPVEDIYFVPIWQYAAAWAEFREDEDAMQSRAKAFYDLFNQGVS